MILFSVVTARSELLAKGMSAIRKLSDKELTDIMESFFDGAVLEVVKKDFPGTTKELLADPCLRTLAEIFARETGFNRVWVVQCTLSFTPFGVYPNNALVGGSGDIAVGAAL
jgi:2-oxoisovalerate dehydrogenase E1 component